jgi:hypothetical protein
MEIFISYARSDRTPALRLHDDLERGGHTAWLDEELEGGEIWWSQILSRIEQCDLFVLGLTPGAIGSRACRAELSYAVALNRRVLPVRLADVNEQLAPEPLPSLQVIDYRDRSPENVIQLLRAVGAAEGARPLPDPLPEPPAAPIAAISGVQELLAAESLSYSQQLDLVRELRQRMENPDEEEIAVALLGRLRSRPDVVESIGQDVTALLGHRPTDTLKRDRGTDPATADLLLSLVTQLRRGHLTPILGWGLTDHLIGPRRDLARSWSRQFEFPLAVHQQDDLPQVARFVAAMTDLTTLRESLAEVCKKRLRDRFPDVFPSARAASLGEMVRLTHEQIVAPNADDPHTILARMPCAVYVTAHPTTLMGDALRQAGRRPEIEICRWRPDFFGWPPSVFDQQPGYTPSPERPLVFHAFGNAAVPESLVITEDDYFEYAISIAANPTLVPLVVRDALADSALLLLGFRLEEWDASVLLRSLVNQEGARRLRKYTHVAAQLDFGEVLSPERARRYLERYFSKLHEPAIDIYWGSVTSFASGLAAAWDADDG